MRLKTVLFVVFVLMASIALTSCKSKTENAQVQKKMQEDYAPPLELDEKVLARSSQKHISAAIGGYALMRGRKLIVDSPQSRQYLQSLKDRKL